MTHTIRIYNRRIKKAQRNNIYRQEEKGWGEMTETEQRDYINSPLLNSISSHGLIYHPYLQCCMGHCPHCRDPTLDQRHQRKIRKREFARILALEMSTE